MRILYVSSEYPPETGFGGIATYTKHISEAMASLGHEVHVLCRATDREYTRKNGGVTVHRLFCEPHPLPRMRCLYPFRKISYWFVLQSLHRISWAKTVCNAVNKLSRNSSFDIIEYPECGAEGYFLSKKRFPTVVRLHTPWTIVHELNIANENPVDCLFQEYLERRSIKNAEIITSPSNAILNMLNKRWKIGQAFVFANPIPVSNYGRKKKGFGWVYTGRLEFRKGVHILVKAYAIVCKKRSPPPLHLIGRSYGNMPDGRTYEQYIRQLIAENGLIDRILITPEVNQTDIGTILNNFEVGFYPSLWENLPYSCLEAMASQTVVCASDCGGFPEMICHGENGLLFKCGDESSLADIMLQLIDNKYKMDELGIQARLNVLEKFDSSVIGKIAEDVYKKNMCS